MFKVCTILMFTISVMMLISSHAMAKLDIVKNVSVHSVPGLFRYIKSNYPNLQITEATVKVRLVELDEISDFRDEVLLEIVDFGSYCNNKGCNFAVLERVGQREFRELVGLQSFDLIVIDGYNKGKRNLALSSQHNAALVRFNGDKYVVIPNGVAALVESNSTKLIVEAKEPESFLGKCYQGYMWSGWPRDPRPGSGADYSECGYAEPVLNFACNPNSQYIEFSIEIEVPGLKVGEQTSVRANMGGKRFILSGLGRHSDSVGGTRPVLHIKKTDSFFSEFRKSSRVSLVFGKTKFTAHLKGSSGAINALFASCR